MQLVIGEDVRKLYKDSFFALSRATFGLQFEQWDTLGFWDHTYRSYAFVDNGTVVANVSVNFAKMVLDGQHFTSAQIGTVMTDERYRGKGLSKKLMDKVMEDLQPIDIIYLFANATVLEFYPKFGFEKRMQATFTIQTAHLTLNPTEVKKLDIDDEKVRELLYQTTIHRRPISTKMAMLQNENIVMFHALTQYRNHIYYVPAFEAIVIAKEQGETFQLIDVISKKYISLHGLLATLPIKAPKIDLCFTPDDLPIPVERGVFQDTGAMFVKEQGTIHYPNDMLYPYSGLA